MGEKIAFPNEPERLLILGKKAMAEKDYLLASRQFQKAYELQPSFETNQLWLESLEKQTQFEAALEVAKDYQTEYFLNEDGFQAYFRLLLLSRRFLQARAYLQSGTQQETLAQLDFSELWQQLAQLETVQQLVDPEAIAERRGLLQRINQTFRPISGKDWDFLIQSICFASFESLLENFLPQLQNPFLRPKLVEELVRLRSQRTYQVPDLSGIKQEVRPDQLVLPVASPALREMTGFIEETLGQEDPVMCEAVVAEVKAHFALAFPFAPQEEDPRKWAESYLWESRALFGDETASAELENYQEIQNQKAQLRKIYANLM